MIYVTFCTSVLIESFDNSVTSFCAEKLCGRFNMFEMRLIKITTVPFGCTEMEHWLKILSNLSCNDETWHSYTLPKKDLKNIQIT